MPGPRPSRAGEAPTGVQRSCSISWLSHLAFSSQEHHLAREPSRACEEPNVVDTRGEGASAIVPSIPDDRVAAELPDVVHERAHVPSVHRPQRELDARALREIESE